MQKDNSTFLEKKKLRLKALSWLKQSPVILETHGGSGRIFKHAYAEFQDGMVFEKDQKKAEFICKQRPTWAVYQSDCVQSLENGAGKWLDFNFLDVDPYGDPWPVITAYINGRTRHNNKLVIVVNDGLRQAVKMGQAWHCESLKDVVKVFGNDIYHDYLKVARWLLEKKVAPAGYAVSHFEGRYVGHNGDMTHYGAIVSRTGGTS